MYKVVIYKSSTEDAGLTGFKWEYIYEQVVRHINLTEIVAKVNNIDYYTTKEPSKEEVQ